MTEQQQAAWPAAAPPPPGWLPRQAPPDLVPSRPHPTYREAHRVRPAPLLAGVGATLIWFALFGSIGRDLLTYAWWTVVAAVSAWAVAIVLSFLGDRGVAAGVALTSSLGLSVAVALVANRWITTNDWPLW